MSCDTAYMSDEEPRLCGGNDFFPILGQSAAAPEPGEGALDDPASGQNFKAVGGVRALDDLHRPVADFVEIAA